MTTSDHKFRYADGTLICLAEWPTCVLVDIASQDPLLEQLADLLDSATPLEAIVDFLSHDGITRTPAFGAMQVGEESVRVVVHGQVRAVVDGNVVEAPQFLTETTVTPLKNVVLQGSTGEARLPISVGVSRASCVEWLAESAVAVERGESQVVPEVKPETTAVAEEKPPSPVVPEPAPAVMAEAKPEPPVAEEAAPRHADPSDAEFGDMDLTAFDHLFGPYTPPGKQGTPAPAPAPSPVNPPVPTPVAAQAAPVVPPAPAVPPAQAAPAAPPVPLIQQQGLPESAPLHGMPTMEEEEDIGRTQISPATTSLAELVEDFKQMGNEPSHVSESSVQHMPGFIDSFDWGPPSQKRSALKASSPVSMSAPIPPYPVEPAPAAPPRSAPVVIPPMPPAPVAPPIPPMPVAQPGGGPEFGGMTSQFSEIPETPQADFSGPESPIVPYPKPSWITGSSQQPVQPVQPVQPERQEPFDATVRKSSLNGLSESGDVMVVAFRCVNGHFSPPYATHCRICGVGLDQSQQPLEVVRPPLGVLKLWAGGTILLDRGVIFGRNPHVVPGTVGPMPNLLKIEDPNRDVSSQHCWIRLEDWYVTVTDLNSTNGTQVILPHRPPLALRANDPVAIEPGSRVILANAFDFVYEVG